MGLPLDDLGGTPGGWLGRVPGRAGPPGPPGPAGRGPRGGALGPADAEGALAPADGAGALPADAAGAAGTPGAGWRAGTTSSSRRGGRGGFLDPLDTTVRGGVAGAGGATGAGATGAVGASAAGANGAAGSGAAGSAGAVDAGGADGAAVAGAAAVLAAGARGASGAGAGAEPGAGASDAPAGAGLVAPFLVAAFFTGLGSSGDVARTSPSRSALRRTRSAWGSTTLDEWLFTPMPSASQRSRHSLLVSPSSRASSYTRMFPANGLLSPFIVGSWVGAPQCSLVARPRQDWCDMAARCKRATPHPRAISSERTK